jgi:hypothetical protein
MIFKELSHWMSLGMTSTHFCFEKIQIRVLFISENLKLKRPSIYKHRMTLKIHEQRRLSRCGLQYNHLQIL